MLNALLSVIIPAHNEERTICRTVDSLLLQDYSHFEIIVVDDGSTDRTDEKLVDRYCFETMAISFQKTQLESKRIIRIWSVKCNNVQLYLVKKENGGKGDALNAGISFCHGEYFVCIDADCSFSTDTLSCLTKALHKGKNIVAVGGRVLPINGLSDFFRQKGFHSKEAIQGYQELEYGMAFRIV